ncbi:hypothetical protein, partial [Streptomyces sp. Mg1]|uniref:hypothetical protein n=1 Tax=Streptomyces sp. Mg1 TaxID=465541 RepID=UPI00017F0FE3
MITRALSRGHAQAGPGISAAIRPTSTPKGPSAGSSARIRPGPVLVDIAKDALQAKTVFSWPPTQDLPGYRPVTKPHAKQIREAA